MSFPRLARLCAAAICGAAVPARAGVVAIDLEEAMVRAAERAPEVAAARGRVGEAAAARVDAAVRFPDEPALAVEAGPRWAGARTVDVAVELAQGLGPPGRGGARRAVADAALALARATAITAGRDARLAAGLAYLDARHADDAVTIERDAAALATRAAEVAERRRSAGEATDLEANLARAAAARARAAVLGAEAERAAAIGALAVRLGVAPDDELVLRGALRPVGEPPAAAGALAARPELVALTAELAVARAEVRLAAVEARPALGAWLGYQREDAATIVVGGVRVTWPIWDRGQGRRAVAGARAARVAAEHAALSEVAARQHHDALAAYRQARDAVAVLDAEVAPLLDDSEALLARSLDAGTLPIGEVLAARRELVAARREALDRVLALARAHLVARLAAEGMP